MDVAPSQRATRSTADNESACDSYSVLRGRDVPESRLGGWRERRMVVDARLTGYRPLRKNWDGLGDFVYLADSYLASGERTGYHEHDGVDVVTVVLMGKLLHRGVLRDECVVEAASALVQCSGSMGFGHDELNTGPETCRVLQIMFLSAAGSGRAGYRTMSLPRDGRHTIYRSGMRGSADESNSTSLTIVASADGERLRVPGSSVIYVADGSLAIVDETVLAGDMLRGTDLCMDVAGGSRLMIVSNVKSPRLQVRRPMTEEA